MRLGVSVCFFGGKERRVCVRACVCVHARGCMRLRLRVRPRVCASVCVWVWVCVCGCGVRIYVSMCGCVWGGAGGWATSVPVSACAHKDKLALVLGSLQLSLGMLPQVTYPNALPVLNFPTPICLAGLLQRQHHTGV